MQDKSNKYGKTFNCSVKDYNKLRTFLRYAFLYGCFTKDDFVERLNYSESLVDKDYKRLLSLLGPKYFIRKTPRQTRFRMNYNYYQNAENYLVRSYYGKSSTKIQMSLYFMLLQLVKKQMDVAEISGQIPSLSEDFDPKTLVRQLDKLVEWELLEKVQYKKKGKLYYRPVKDFFSEFDDLELQQLKTAVEFFCNIEFPSIPGYYLSNTIESYMRHCRKRTASEKNLFLYRFKGFHTILEEDIAWRLLSCIEGRQKIRLEYQSGSGINHIELSPLKLVIDIQYGRWYLLGSTGEGLVKVCRLDRISGFTALKDRYDNEDDREKLDKALRHSWCVGMPNNGGKPSALKIRFSVPEKQNITFLLDKVGREGKWGTITEVTDNSFIYSITVNDANEIKPWIRSFGAYAEVIESVGCSLREELAGEWREMLKSYGAIS